MNNLTNLQNELRLETITSSDVFKFDNEINEWLQNAKVNIVQITFDFAPFKNNRNELVFHYTCFLLYTNIK